MVNLIIIIIRYSTEKNKYTKMVNDYLFKHRILFLCIEFMIATLIGYNLIEALTFICSILICYIMSNFDNSVYKWDEKYKSLALVISIVLLYYITAALEQNKNLLQTSALYLVLMLMSPVCWLWMIIVLAKRFIQNIYVYEIRELIVHLIIIFISIISIFVSIYEMGYVFWGCDFIKNENLSWVDMIYFSITIFTSTGFGDITPNNYYAKFAASLEMILGTIFNGGFVAILVSRFLDIRKNCK